MSEVIYGQRTNDLGDVLCVFPGTSDWGDLGWFLGRELRAPGREPFRTTMSFFPGTGMDSRRAALAAMREDYVFGFETQEEADKREGMATFRKARVTMSAARVERRVEQLQQALTQGSRDTEHLVVLMRHLHDALVHLDSAKEAAG